MLHDDELREICAEAQTFGLSPYDAATEAIDRDYSRGQLEQGEIEIAFVDYETKCARILEEIGGAA